MNDHPIRPDNGKPATGVILYRGPSAIDGAPIAVVLVGLQDASTNSKTGGMLQTHIIRTDISPTEAYRLGEDTSVCGPCRLRSVASGGTGGCYVNLGQGPRAVHDGLERGIYTQVGPRQAARIITASGRGLRVGSYGDPAAVPAPRSFWEPLIEAAAFHTGYTHQARSRGRSLRGLVMASADTAADRDEYVARGWGTFRVAPYGEPVERIRGEAHCPASEEAGRKVTCATCPLACNGIGSRVIIAHGATRKRV